MGSSIRHEIEELMRRVDRVPGYQAKVSRGGGHWHVTDEDGQLLVVAARTPSDWRSVKNTTAELRRAGVPVGKTKFDKQLERETMRATEKVRPGQLPESQAKLIATINDYLHAQGHTANGKRDGLRAKFARDALRAVPDKLMRKPKTFDSLNQTMSRLMTHGLPVTPWVEDFLWTALEKLNAQQLILEAANNGDALAVEVEVEAIEQVLEELEQEGLVEFVPDEEVVEVEESVTIEQAPFDETFVEQLVDETETEAERVRAALAGEVPLPLRMLAALMTGVSQYEAFRLVVEMEARMK